jgi:hypothetical protein
MTDRPARSLADRLARAAGFFHTSLGKASLGLFAGVLCVCFPQVPGYAAAAFALYHCVHQFRPVASGIYQDLRNDLGSRNRRA